MNRMIKRTFIVALILLIAHYMLVIIVNPWWNTAQNHQQSNVIKAQKYIYSESKPPSNIIVGSSLSYRLKGESLKRYLNMSMIGLGIIEGLQIISARKELPDTIFIEMNMAFKPENTGFIDRVFMPVLLRVKKELPILQVENQPVGIAGSLVKYFVVSKVFSAVEKFYIPKEGKVNPFAGQRLEQVIDESVKTYSTIPDEDFLDKHFEKIRNLVTNLKAKGVKIVFFEMPVNCRLKNLPWATSTREYFKKYFPTEQNAYIPLPGCEEYITTDGMHLTASEANTYTSFFKLYTKELKSIN